MKKINTKFIGWGQDLSYSKNLSPIENSLSIIKQSSKFGFDGVEIDIQITADNVPILMHDDTISRTTNGKGLVSRLSLSAIKKLRLKDSQGNTTNEEIPTLSEALGEIQENQILMIDCRKSNEQSQKIISKNIAHSKVPTKNIILLAYSLAHSEILKKYFENSTILLKFYQHPEDLSEYLENPSIGALINSPKDPSLIKAIKNIHPIKKIGVFLHHRGLSKQTLLDLALAGADYITTQNHHYCTEIHRGIYE
jgi:glycerophosphoryl diester phosphodiesterase